MIEFIEPVAIGQVGELVIMIDTPGGETLQGDCQRKLTGVGESGFVVCVDEKPILLLQNLS